jgi:putative ABC transport system permease protein
MNSVSPPKLPLRFFRWYCHRDFTEDIEGDLVERFYRNSTEKSIRAARWTFIKDIIRLCRPGIIKSFEGNYQLNHYGMLKNYFTMALRSMLKQKLYTSINIGGLATGLTCFILIFLYVQFEFSFDDFYLKKDRIYRIYQQQAGNDYLGSDYFAVTPAGLANNLTDEVPGVEHASTIQERTSLIKYDDNSFLESGYWADDSFFKIFDYSFLHGKSSSSMAKPNSIVLTKSLSDKIFTNKNALGELLIISDYYGDKEYEVTGVIEDLPINSSFNFLYITNIRSSNEYIRDIGEAKWNNNSCHTFLTIKPGADVKQLEAKFPELIKKYSNNKIGEDYPFEDTYYIQTLDELHLSTQANFDIGRKGNAQFVYLFSAIALIVLILACINYMNLAIARSIQRAKEVGLRKVIGAMRWQLIGQFLAESIFIASVSLVMAICLAYLLIPTFNYIFESQLSLNLFDNKLLVSVLTTLTILVGIFSGSYPAFFMSSLQPVNTLKGKINNLSPKMKLQSLLVVIQYAASIVLVISSIVIYFQFDFIQQQEMGYDKDHIIVIKTRSPEIRKNFDAIRNELSQYSNVLSVSTSNSLPSDIGSSSIARLHESELKEKNIAIYRTTTDHNYLETFGIKVIAGRYYASEEQNSDQVVINESAAKAFGWTPEEAIGNQFYLVGQSYVTVIGVLKDFHMFSLHLNIQPLMITLRRDYFNYASVKVKPDNLPNTIDLLEKTTKKYSQYPFDFQFMDAEFDRLYKSDIRMGSIIGLFTMLSILVASLGLFGMAAYMTKQRTKEIGIRKTLGASLQAIIHLTTKDFLKMIIAGYILALPFAWYLMNKWLENYAYKINLKWWMFLSAGLFAFVIAIFTVGTQSIKAANTNPVDSLRNE